MSERPILERNLLALSRMNRSAAVKITAAGDEELEVRTSRTGLPVPCPVAGGRTAPLHSLMDPEREAERVCERYTGGGFYVVLGFGAGYMVRRLLMNPAVSQILIIDTDVAYFRALFSRIDCSDILLKPRVGMLIDPDDGELAETLLASYIPSLSGDLSVVPLRARTDTRQEFFARVSDRIRALITTVSDDYSVQAFFGKRWFTNTLRNLRHAQADPAPLSPIRRALVTAAGPSLEDSIERIRALAGRYAVIATDTTLPCLLAHGIRPSIVVSIDCQHISYYHFICGLPGDIPLVLDLASPEELTHFTGNLHFFSSGHPFSRYITSRWRRFPEVDTSGGNVTHAAVSLAETLGADEILLFGADFSYPDGKSYARETYIYPYFERTQGRLAPLEHDFVAFMFRNTKIIRERSGGSIRYATKPLIGYKENLERYAQTLQARLVPEPGRGVPISVPERPARPERFPVARPLFSAGNQQVSLTDFVRDYRDAVRALPVPQGPFGAYLASLDAAQRDVLTTLLPTAARARREHKEDGMDAAEMIESVKDWVIDAIAACYPTV